MLDFFTDAPVTGNASSDPTESIILSHIRVDGGTQMRAALDNATVAEYADAMRRGDKFPAIKLFYDGSDHWLADGFHRLAAHKQAHGSAQPIEAIVRPGTRRDAILHAAAANADHGLRRTAADKRRAVDALLLDDEWSQWSDREIGRRTATTHPFVAKRRAALTAEGKHQPASTRTYTDRHGNTATMDTTNIGTSSPPAPSETQTDTNASAPNKRAVRQLSLDETIALIWRWLRQEHGHADDSARLLAVKNQIQLRDLLALLGDNEKLHPAIEHNARITVRKELSGRIKHARRKAERRAAVKGTSPAPDDVTPQSPTATSELKIWQLESLIRSWLEQHPSRSPKGGLLRFMTKHKSGGEWNALESFLGYQTYRRSGLAQALNNVASQMEAADEQQPADIGGYQSATVLVELDRTLAESIAPLTITDTLTGSALNTLAQACSQALQ